MKWPSDYHMHTPLCRHAKGEPLEYAARAVELGLTEIGFSDHAPMPSDNFDDWRMRADQLDEYVVKVNQARVRFPELKILLALEVDYLPGCEEWVRQLAGSHDWDYFIGSVHYVNKSWDIDNPYKLAEWDKHDVNEVWRQYLERLKQAAGSGLFQIIGHCDLPKKFNHRPQIDIGSLFESFFHTASQNGVVIELNTAGLRKECREIYPSQSLLDMAFKCGVKITFGSDAHAPEEVGCDMDKAMESARKSGYSHYMRFEKRKAAPCPL